MSKWRILGEEVMKMKSWDDVKGLLKKLGWESESDVLDVVKRSLKDLGNGREYRRLRNESVKELREEVKMLRRKVKEK